MAAYEKISRALVFGAPSLAFGSPLFIFVGHSALLANVADYIHVIPFLDHEKPPVSLS
jgi:hypothetical protein